MSCRSITKYFLVLLIVVLFGLTQIKKVEAVGISWHTFLGQAGGDNGYGVATDSEGNLYAGGWSAASWGNPIHSYTGGNDFFIAKFNPAGDLLWNTFYGGTGSDLSFELKMDKNENIYITGSSNATWGTPIRAYSSGTDLFVAKFDKNGTLLWNTFMGGTGTDTSNNMDLDADGNVYITGNSSATWGNPVNAYTADIDGIVLKVSSAGDLIWHTFLGSAQTDRMSPITINNGYVYAGGYSYGAWGNPIRPYTAGQDAFIVKLSTSDGSIAWTSFFGGSGTDTLTGATTDKNGNMIFVGQSNASWGTPLSAYTEGSYDVLVVRINSSGDLLWNTFWGGTATDSLISVVTDNDGNLYAAGQSDATWGTPVRPYSADRDVLITKFTSDGSLLWHSFYGGTGYDLGRSIHIDNNGNLYFTGPSTVAWGNPIRAYSGNYDSSVVKLDERAPNTTDNISTIWHNDDVTVALNCTDNLWGSGCGTTYYTTDGTDPTTSSLQGNTLTLSAEGTYIIKYFSIDNAENIESTKTAGSVIKIDKVAPNKPIITDIGKITNIPVKDSITYYFTDQNPRIKGISEPDSVVTFIANGHTYTTITNSRGHYELQITIPVLVRGSNILTYFASDRAGNNSAKRVLKLIIGEENFPTEILPTSESSIVVSPTPTPTVTDAKGENDFDDGQVEAIVTKIQIIAENNGTNVLKDTTVKLDGAEYITDENGYIMIKNTKVGEHTLEVYLKNKHVQLRFSLNDDEIQKGKQLTIVSEHANYWFWSFIAVLILIVTVLIIMRNKKSS